MSLLSAGSISQDSTFKSPLLRESLSTIDTDNTNTDKLWEGKYISPGLYMQWGGFGGWAPLITSCQPGFFVQISAALSILDRIPHKSHVTSITIIPGFAIISVSNSTYTVYWSIDSYSLHNFRTLFLLMPNNNRNVFQIYVVFLLFKTNIFQVWIWKKKK